MNWMAQSEQNHLKYWVGHDLKRLSISSDFCDWNRKNSSVKTNPILYFNGPDYLVLKLNWMV